MRPDVVRGGRRRARRAAAAALTGVALALLLADRCTYRQALAQEPGEEGARVRPETALVAWIPIEQHLDTLAYGTLETRFEDALARKPRFIVFSIGTDSGDYQIGPDLADSVRYLAEEAGVTTVAYVRGTSPGAVKTMLAFACHEIAMRERSAIGGCDLLDVWGPFAREAEGEPAERWRKKLLELGAWHDELDGRTDPDEQGPWGAIARAMCEKGTVAYRVNLDDGSTEIATQDVIDRWRRRKKAAIVDQTELGGGGSFLILGADQARETGIARYLVSGEDALLEQLAEEHGYEPDALQTVRIEASAWESVVRFLNLPAVRLALLAVGLLGLALSVMVQGSGVPEAVTVVAFSLFFFSSYLMGLADWIEIILFGIGVVLLVIEIFVTPGFAVMGGTGIVLVLASLVLAMQRFAIPTNTEQWSALGFNVIVSFGAMVVALGAFSVLIRVLPQRSFGGLMNTQELTAEAGYDVRVPGLEKLAGRRGVAKTPLRPAGKMEVGDELYDVTTEGDWIQPGDPVVVLRVEGNRVFVAAAPPEGAGDAAGETPATQDGGETP